VFPLIADVYAPFVIHGNDCSRLRSLLRESFQEMTEALDPLLRREKKDRNHGTQDSRVVPHRGTNWAAHWLTAQIERDAVLSKFLWPWILYSLRKCLYAVLSDLRQKFSDGLSGGVGRAG
jgi:hypothetical protein